MKIKLHNYAALSEKIIIILSIIIPASLHFAEEVLVEVKMKIKRQKDK